jgi:UDP-N-acetylglucosamine--N-acetylmuramyl-(pentapeptide) pyrophosphoryl-undecaprenol N-acetylglucosamine transferase
VVQEYKICFEIPSNFLGKIMLQNNNMIVLAAGGTGGHVFPAIALAEALQQNGEKVLCITDPRASKFFAKISPEIQVKILPLRSLQGGFIKRIIGVSYLWLSCLYSLAWLLKARPKAVVGFGGYPSFPALAAAWILNIPFFLHEQNAILGRSNRYLVRSAKALFTAYPETKSANARKIIYVGTPVRLAIRALATQTYPNEAQELRLLVVGGSQGANIFSEVVPQALSALPENIRSRLFIIQQCSETAQEEIASIYTKKKIRNQLATFFHDMPEQLSRAHLVITRAGASSLAELALAGKPAIMIPYPHAMDDHQTANAKSIVQAGGGITIAQKEFSVEKLTEILAEIFSDHNQRAQMAKSMRSLAKPNAAQEIIKSIYQKAA